MLGDVLDSEGPEGLRSVLYDDSPGVGTVFVVVLDHLGQGLTGLHSSDWLRVSPGDENFVLSVWAQLGQDGTEVRADVRLRLGLHILGEGETGQYLETSILLSDEGYCYTHQDQHQQRHQCSSHVCLSCLTEGCSLAT